MFTMARRDRYRPSCCPSVARGLQLSCVDLSRFGGCLRGPPLTASGRPSAVPSDQTSSRLAARQPVVKLDRDQLLPGSECDIPTPGTTLSTSESTFLAP